MMAGPLGRALAVASFVLATTAPAAAWKIDTHIWLADQIADEVAAGRRVDLGPLGGAAVGTRLTDAIAGHRGAFLMGALGPDTYPDMVAGQMTTHPGLDALEALEIMPAAKELATLLGQTEVLTKDPGPWTTDDWLAYLRGRGWAPGASDAEIAFTHGYLTHAAMDMWAHSYVNIYAGDVFSLLDEQEVEFRHMAIEGLVKRTHESFLPPRPPSANPLAVALRTADRLTPLAAPVGFVRRNLILDPLVAAQYGREKTTLHLFAAYIYWSEVRDLQDLLDPLRNALDQAVTAAASALDQADAALEVAEVARRGALDAVDSAQITLSVTESNAKASAAAVETIVRQALGHVAALADNVVDQLPPNVRQGYRNARRAALEAERLFERAKTAYEDAVAARDAAIDDWQAALADVDLREEADASLNAARNTALASAEAGLQAWTSDIERALDAYIRAWEETSKELMRPKSTRFSPGGDVTEPLKRWVLCWGPTFGLPAAAALAPGCERARGTYRQLARAFDVIPANVLLGHPGLREKIEAFDDRVETLAGEALVQIAGMVSATIRVDNGLLAGHARSIVNLRSHDPSAAAMDDEFDDDTSNKGLMVFPQAPGSRITALLYKDMGIGDLQPHQRRDLSLDQLGDFAALQNASTMAKLSLLDGRGLRNLILSTGNRSPYPAGARAGVALIGVLRSIDGDHQWQREAPPLPRARGLQDEERVFGYGADNPNDALRPGFSLWQDPVLRSRIFNELFKGPLTPGLVEFLGAGALARGIGICALDPYPPTGGPDACRERTRPRPIPPR